MPRAYTRRSVIQEEPVEESGYIDMPETVISDSPSIIAAEKLLDETQVVVETTRIVGGQMHSAPQDGRDIILIGEQGEEIRGFWYKTRIFDGSGWKPGYRWARSMGYGALGFTPVAWRITDASV